jgi:hypothetical protein
VEDTPSKLESLGEEEEEEGEVISRQVGVTVDMRQLRRTRTETGSSTDLP